VARSRTLLTQDPIGLAGGVNLYSYAGNNPIAFSEPYGLCVPVNVCLAVAGALIGGGTRIAYNLYKGNDWTKGVGSDMAKGAAIGLTFGLAAPAVATAAATSGGTASTVAAEAGGAVAANANKLNHIFGKAEHGLSGLVQEFGGASKALNGIQQAINAHVADNKITGRFEQVVKVGSEMVTVRGNVIDGAVKIGTAFVAKE
jgi:uncharacterized protein RhaS with RHS repeats